MVKLSSFAARGPLVLIAANNQTEAFKSTPNAWANALTKGLRTMLWRSIKLNGVTM